MIIILVRRFLNGTPIGEEELKYIPVDNMVFEKTLQSIRARLRKETKPTLERLSGNEEIGLL